MLACETLCLEAPHASAVPNPTNWQVSGLAPSPADSVGCSDTQLEHSPRALHVHKISSDTISPREQQCDSLAVVSSGNEEIALNRNDLAYISGMDFAYRSSSAEPCWDWEDPVEIGQGSANHEVRETPQLFWNAHAGSYGSNGRNDFLMVQVREAAEAAANLRCQAAHFHAQAQKVKKSAQLLRLKAGTPSSAQKRFEKLTLTEESLKGQVGSNGAETCPSHARALSTSSSAHVPPASPEMADEESCAALDEDCGAAQVSMHAKLRPKARRQQQLAYFHEAAPNAVTELQTLLLRNIPNGFSRNHLCGLLDLHGFSCGYDFIYLPMDFHRCACLGYAFINFTSPENAGKAKETFEGFSQWGVSSQKVCKVEWCAPLQGLDEHIEQYRDKSVMHDSVPDCYKPAIYEGGIRQPFPAPRLEVPTPRMRRGFPGFRVKRDVSEGKPA